VDLNGQTPDPAIPNSGTRPNGTKSNGAPICMPITG
jgi:hypothetical protein